MRKDRLGYLKRTQTHRNASLYKYNQLPTVYRAPMVFFATGLIQLTATLMPIAIAPMM